MNLNDDPISLYEVLELTPDATPQEIRSAYLRLKSSYGKDNIAHYTLFSREETETMLQKIEEAYIVLSNPERRRAYDQSQGHSSSIHIDSLPTAGSASPVGTMAALSTGMTGTSSPINDSVPFDANDVESLIHHEQEWSGAILRRIREAKRISLDDLSDYTRISKSYLQALENEDYNRLPATIYVRGFLQQVSKRLKLPIETVVQKYLARIKAARPDK